MKRFAVGIVTVLSFATAAPAQDALDVARSHREAHGAAILAMFRDLLAIPNYAFDTENIQRNAQTIAAEFEKRGAIMELLTLPRHASVPPLIYGAIDVPGAKRTIGIYVHYDGQPVDESRWTTPPWAPALRTRALGDGGEARPFPGAGEAIDPEWRIYARGAGDDKAPLAALLAALDALRAADIAITSNIRFMFEGEEEVGSLHLREYFAHYGEKFSEVDAWLICDGPVHQSRRPQLVFGVRGVTGLDITVYGATHELHSGHYGNFAPNPAMMLAQLLASMKDEQGNVLVEGYYDTVEPLSERERAALAAAPDIDGQLRREFGLASSEAGNAPYLERLLLPSLNIKGLAGGAAGPQSRNVIPTEATASLDLRLVKGNDPVHMQELVEAHIARQGYFIVREAPDPRTRFAHEKIALVSRRSGYPAARSSMDGPLVEPLRRAAARASGQDVVMMPSLGGSLPLYLFNEMLGTPVIIVPIANHDDNQHAPDENLRIANLWYGIDLYGLILTME